MSHGSHHDDPDTMFSAPFWDDRYASGETTWSGNPNPHLVERIADLVPGTALDAGSGDGSDSLWLASRGWEVTGVDVSQVALDLAARRAADAGVGDRITWQQADLREWAPPAASYDLVSAQFMHLPGPVLDDLHRRLAAAVAPGGTLLVVLHHPSHLEEHADAWAGPPMFRTPEEVAAVLDDGWDVTAEAPSRTGMRDGAEREFHDTLVLATRHGSKR
ncbi:MAG: Methyltransferase / FAD-dependent pyridine nucleotide-disulfide oxidoreductase [Nocardioidaceae bacterium]|nr:Methyltransferase / FAD-dependent pyridine nucleotide-disulfide oxidoreductase [Nocardioidaceae bacterium]